MSDQDIIMDLTVRAQEQDGRGDLWVTQEEWDRLKVHLSSLPGIQVKSFNPGGATLFGMNIKIKVDYLTEVVKAHAPEEE